MSKVYHKPYKRVPRVNQCPHGLDKSECHTCTTAQKYWDNYRPKDANTQKERQS